MNFITYDAIGKILRTGSCPDDHMQLQAGIGETVIEGRANDSTDYIADGLVVAMPPKPSEHHAFDYTTKQWQDPRTLVDLKALKWQEIKQARDTQEVSGFPYLGKQVDSDSRSVQRITTAVQSADAAQRAAAAFAIEWTCADNTSLALDGPAMQGMPVALAMHANTLHEKARSLRIQINSATTALELNSITWDSA